MGEEVLQLPDEVFESSGGSGHSLTNTLWFLGTRKEVNVPLTHSDIDCGCPATCTLAEQRRDAEGLTCVERIQWLKEYEGISEKEACTRVSHEEFPTECSACDPASCGADKNNTKPGKNEEKPNINCGCPKTCTNQALANNADGDSCKTRIEWLMVVQGNTELEACNQIGGVEFRNECASCDPDRCQPFTIEKTDEDVLQRHGNLTLWSLENVFNAVKYLPIAMSIY